MIEAGNESNPNTGLIVNCPLCEERSLHVIGSTEHQILQCINCGYVSSPKFMGSIEDNEEYKKLEPDMQSWAKEAMSRVWIPTIMTLPTGLIYPFDENGKMRWGYAKMKEIAEEDRHNYPVEGTENQFYERMYDVENHEVFDEFVLALSKVNNIFKEQSQGQSQQPSELKLPKLKKL